MIAALLILAWLVVIALALCLFAGSAETTCNQNCNPGRDCTRSATKSTHA